MDGNCALGGVLLTGLDADLGANPLDTGRLGQSMIGSYSLSRDVLSTFARGAFDGALYDYPNISSLYQDSAGTTPVAVVTDPVGLSLDSRLGLVLGPELMPGGGTLDSSTGWQQYSGVISGGVLTVVADTLNNCSLETNPPVLTAGKFYKVVYVVDSITGSVGMAVGGVNAAAYTAPGTYTEYITAVNSTCRVYTRSAGASYVISNISVKLLDGNHALQSTAASRPTWSNRINLLLATNTLSTQNVTTVAGSYILSFTGTGTITLSGTSTSGPLVGTGAGDRVSLTFTPTAGTLTLTVSGSVTFAQLEFGA